MGLPQISQPQAPRTDEITLVPLEQNRYAIWDQFCLENSEAWFWHTSHWIEYTLHYRPDLRPQSRSFICLLRDRVVAICPLILESYAATPMVSAEFSFGGDATPMPALADDLSDADRKMVSQAVFGRVDALARELKVGRVSFRAAPVSPHFWNLPQPQENPLMKLGFQDISLATQVIDLSPDETQLLRDMRKGHRADITRAAKLLDAFVLDKDTITRKSFESYRMLHHKAAGRVTRPLATFEMMFQWIQQGTAVLCCAKLGALDVGFALVSVYKDAAYYSSSCEDPEHNFLPIGHILQWKVMQWLKTHGIRRYEIGMQPFPGQSHTLVSDKELRIAFFKRGFGGMAVPFWRGEKFYSREYYVQVSERRTRAFAEYLSESFETPS